VKRNSDLEETMVPAKYVHFITFSSQWETVWYTNEILPSSII